MLNSKTIRRASGRTAGNCRAFTLVELMVVVLILGILTALAVTVGQYVLQKADENATKATQKILLAAIEAYYNAYTDPVTGEHAYPPTERPDDEGLSSYGTNYDIFMSGATLLEYLTGRHYKYDSPTAANYTPTVAAIGERTVRSTDLVDHPAVKAAQNVLNELPPDSLLMHSDGAAIAVQDSWGFDMWYEPDGGINGPVIISRGPDGKTDPFIRIQVGGMQPLGGAAYMSDDIRSDGRN